MTADTFSNTLGFLIMGTGNDNNTWGANANTSVFQVLEDAIANALTSSVTGGTLDLSGSPPPAAPSQVRYAALIFNGVLGSNQTIQVPNLPKFWYVQNATSAAFTLKFKTPTGAASTAIPQNSGWQVVYCDGANNIIVFPTNTKQLQMPDGSASAPAFSNINETNSGWYRAGTQDWRFAINGVDVIQSTGPGAGTPSVFNVLSPNALQIAGITITTGSLVPTGSEMPFAGINLPAGWLWEDGAAISRAGQANLFNAITTTVVGNTNGNTSLTSLATDMRGKGLDGAFVEGTGIPTGTTITFTGASTATLSAPAVGTNAGLTFRILPFGQGDGSTTYNVPDRRYRALFGRDDMNNNPAGRSSAFLGKRLATTGGEESHTLTIPELPAHNHTITDPGHLHGLWQANNSNVVSGAGTIPISNINPGTNGTGTQFGTTATAPTGITINNAGSGSAHNTMPVFGITNYIIKT